MKIWLVTTGSSDVQLKTNEYWNDWYRLIKPACHHLTFEPTQAIKDAGEPYRIAPRVLGMAYQACPDEVWDALEFPLLKEFTAKLKDEEIAQIILLLTDQSTIFAETQREDIKCPYWQDTCELQPIFERYFKTHFPDAELVTLKAAPQPSEPGLDDWNAVLELVRARLKQEISVDPATVYVSHQAGTPAISSAVQFSSLAKFSDRVKFLVSNEYNPELTDILPSSNYLIALKKRQAEKLLERYDYSAVKEALSDYLSEQEKLLLEAAIQWNYAQFDHSELEKSKTKNVSNDSFANQLSQHPQFVTAVVEWTKPEHWWWTAYEAAYLGVVRLKQGNTVEAMFHSFRAVEGLLKTWSDKIYPGEIKQAQHPRWQENERWNRNLNSYGQDLYWFLTIKKSIDQNKDIKQNKTPDIFIFGTRIFDKRNELFHNLKGLQGKEEVFENWRSPNEPSWKHDPESKWKIRVLNCLNCISAQDFKSLEDASLMFKVHQELVKAIDKL